MKTYDAVIIGAGQAGITMGYYLKKAGTTYTIVEKNKRVGDSWRQRYDSLVLFTPRKFSSLPELQMRGAANGFPTKDEVANYLEEYVRHFNIPIKCNTDVLKLEKIDHLFYVTTNQELLITRKVIVASGTFQKPLFPNIFKKKETNPFQLHSSIYLSPNKLHKGSVVVVGGGNSGAQIAVELAKAGKEVSIATSQPFTFLPLRLFGQSIFTWLQKSGLLHADIETLIGKWFRKKQDPIFGKELKRYIQQKRIVLKPKVVQVEGKTVTFADNSQHSYENIIWATGFIPSYEWIHIDGALTSSGSPLHERGISPIQGLYFLGLPWQSQRGSALICGVHIDAKYILPYVID